MSVFMDLLREEMEKILEIDIEIPTFEVKDGERVVGTLKDVEVKKLYELGKRLNYDLLQQSKDAFHKAIDAIDEESSEDHDPATCEYCALQRQLMLFKDKIVTLKALFWTCVRYELSEDALIERDKMGSDGIGIRKDWQIVLTKRNNSPETPFSLEFLL